MFWINSDDTVEDGYSLFRDEEIERFENIYTEHVATQSESRLRSWTQAQMYPSYFS